jgi:hypothetical protein
VRKSVNVGASLFDFDIVPHKDGDQKIGKMDQATMNKSISNKGSTLHPISSSNAKNDLVMMGNGQKPKKSTIQRSKSNEGLDHEMQKIDE